MVLVLKALLGDIALTKVRRDLRRLNQRIALLETGLPMEREDDPLQSSEAGAESGEKVRRSAVS